MLHVFIDSLVMWQNEKQNMESRNIPPILLEKYSDYHTIDGITIKTF